MPIGTTRTTLSLPADLLEAIDSLQRRGRVRSRSGFITSAVRHALEAEERAEIDAAFSGMAQDGRYQAEAQEIAREFAEADWEAFQLAEGGG